MFEEHAEDINHHLSRFFEEEEMSVFHEIVTIGLHIDVYLIDSKQADFKILLTSGMSTLEMNFENEEDGKELKFAELMLLIPKEIEFQQTTPSQADLDWIIGMLKQTANFPHDYSTWLGIGHTIQATRDLESYHKNTDFAGVLLLPSITFDSNFTTIKTDNGTINIYSVFPLYKEELEFKIKNGYQAFLNLIIKNNVNEIFNPNRKSLVS